MNANTIITDDMTLDEKLAAIDAAMQKAVEAAQENAREGATANAADVSVPVDPADLTMCLGCQ